MKRILQLALELLVIEPQRAYREIIANRYWVYPLIAILFFECLAVVYTGEQRAADSAYSLTHNSRLSMYMESFTESELREIFRPNTARIVQAALFAVFWAALEIMFFTGFLTLVGLAVTYEEAKFAELFSVVVNATLITGVVAKFVELPLAFFHDSVFYSKLSMAAFFLDLGSLHWAGYVLEQLDFFILWRLFSMGIGVAMHWGTQFGKGLIIVTTIWLFKILIVTSYLWIAFGR